jgi:long-chain fatty acid transport protein
MGKLGYMRLAGVSAVALLSGLALTEQANAGSFGVREQSAYYQGMSFAGSAAGGDISSMFWNSAATASLPGFNTSTNATVAFGSADMHAEGGSLFYANPLHDANIGTDAFIPASYTTYQLNDRLFVGLATNAPFGFITKPDAAWSGISAGTTSKIFSFDINPTVAYKLTPELTIGIGAQVEYFKIKLSRGVGIAPRNYTASDWGVGGTAGVIWQPTSRTSFGLGYRSSVGVDVEGTYRLPSYGFGTTATGAISLPDEVTFSVRHALTPRLTVLGSVEWQNWSRVDNVRAISTPSPYCPGGVCETLHLNYQDGWLYSVGAEYAYSPSLTLRTGVAFETSPITNETRNILIPDSDRIHASAGLTYKYSDRISVDLAYTHIFFDDAPFCIAATATSHCASTTPSAAKVLYGSADVAVDLVSVGLKYKSSDPIVPLEPYK